MKIFKKAVGLLSMMVCSFALSVTAFATDVEKIAPGEFNLVLNSKRVAITQNNEPVKIEETTLLPFQFVFDLVNARQNGTYFVNQEAVTVKIGDQMLTLKIDQDEAELNGVAITLDGPGAITYNGMVYAPVDAIAEIFGYTLSWDVNTNTLYMIDDAEMSEMLDLVETASQKINLDNKLFMEMNMWMDMLLTAAGSEPESINISFDSNTKVEMDLKAPYMHYHMQYSFDMSPLMGKEEFTEEMYDDGEYTYINSEELLYKTKSTTASMNQIQALVQENLGNYVIFENKEYFSTMTLNTNADGNYVIAGNLNLTSDFLNSIMADTFSQIGFNSFFDIPSIDLTKPIYCKYVIDQNKKEFHSISMTFSFAMEMDILGEQLLVDCDFEIDIPQIHTRAKFDSVVSQDIKENAVDYGSLLNWILEE